MPWLGHTVAHGHLAMAGPAIIDPIEAQMNEFADHIAEENAKSGKTEDEIEDETAQGLRRLVVGDMAAAGVRSPDDKQIDACVKFVVTWDAKGPWYKTLDDGKRTTIGVLRIQI